MELADDAKSISLFKDQVERKDFTAWAHLCRIIARKTISVFRVLVDDFPVPGNAGGCRLMVFIISSTYLYSAVSFSSN